MANEVVDRLKDEFEFYLENQSDLVADYDGKVIVIKDRAVIGVYEDELTAVTASQAEHALGTFLVQRVSSEDGSRTFHTRAVFS